MKLTNPLMPLPNYVNVANKINHYTLPIKQANKSEALSESVRTVVKHLQPSKKPEAAKTSRLADLEADVFTPERQTSKGISEKSKNVGQNRGDKAAMEKYFDAPLPDEAQIEKEKWYASVATELEQKDMQKSQERLNEFNDEKQRWEEHLQSNEDEKNNLEVPIPNEMKNSKRAKVMWKGYLKQQEQVRKEFEEQAWKDSSRFSRW